jgi:NAD-dependent SIR2 family protein deacetylase
MGPKPAQVFDDLVPLLERKGRALTCDECHLSLTGENIVISNGQLPLCGNCGAYSSLGTLLLKPNAEWYLEEGLPI